MRTLTHAEWKAEGAHRFGDDINNWRFICPSCGHIASVADYRALGASPGAIAFSCIGRFTDAPHEAFAGPGTGPCNYAGGGLFAINPVTVVYSDGKEMNVFEFAEAAHG